MDYCLARLIRPLCRTQPVTRSARTLSSRLFMLWDLADADNILME